MLLHRPTGILVCRLLTTPPGLRRPFGDLLPAPLAQDLRPRLSAHAPQGDRSRVLALTLGARHGVFQFARRDLGDHDSAGVYVGGGLLPPRAAWHSIYSRLVSIPQDFE